MAKDSLSIRLMKLGEEAEVFHIIDAEGWSLTMEKFALIYKAKPNSFYVVVSEKDNILATFSLTPTFKDEYVIGNLVVRSEFRGRGIGRHIMRECLLLVPHYAAMSLTAVPEAMDFYANIGIPISKPEHGHVVFYIDAKPSIIESKVLKFQNDLKSIQIVKYDSSRLVDLITYDNAARHYDNTMHTTVVTETAKVIIAENPSSKQLIGYAASYLYRNVIALHGLYADSDAVAIELFRHAIQAFSPLSRVRLQTFKSNQMISELGDIVKSYEYVRFSYGSATVYPDKSYSVSDSDYTV